MAEELDAETIAFTHRMFDLARSGATDELAGFLTAAFFDLPEMAALLRGE